MNKRGFDREMLLIGIDVGGTHTKFGLIRDGEIVRKLTLATNTFDIVKQIANGARELIQSEGINIEDIDGVAVGFPGMVVNSVVLESPNIGLQNCNIKELLEEDLGSPVIVKNDAEMAVLAEHRFGAGRNCNNMVLITLGTGVGGAIIVNGELYSGMGGAAELGHITMDRNGRPCTCGRVGCAEQYVSMTALDRLAKETMASYPNTCVSKDGDGSVYASEIMRAYNKNDACAMEIAGKYVKELSAYILNLCNMFRPEKIVIGGGIANAPELIKMTAIACKEAAFGYKNSPKVEILVAELGNEAGMLGSVVCFEEGSSNVEYAQGQDEPAEIQEPETGDEVESIVDEQDYQEEDSYESEQVSEYEPQPEQEEERLDTTPTFANGNMFADNDYPENTPNMFEDAEMPEEPNYNVSDMRDSINDLSEMVSASVDDVYNDGYEEDTDNIVYDENLLNKVNDILKKKNNE